MCFVFILIHLIKLQCAVTRMFLFYNKKDAVKKASAHRTLGVYMNSLDIQKTLLSSLFLGCRLVLQ